MWLHAPHLRSCHGFSTRSGGFSSAPYDSLNFDDRQDDPRTVARNRAHALGALGFNPAQLCHLEQVHSTEVLEAHPGQQVGDALVSSMPGLVLAIGTADCYPILLEDPDAGVIGAAHAGWKGTLGRIARKTVEAMCARGARPERIRAAIGPGICGQRYEVSPDLAQKFLEAGFSESVVNPNPQFVLRNPSGTIPNSYLNLLEANRHVLLESGLLPEHLWAMERCSTEPDFFSYRRDAGQTGRMWAVIGL